MPAPLLPTAIVKELHRPRGHRAPELKSAPGDQPPADLRRRTRTSRPAVTSVTSNTAPVPDRTTLTGAAWKLINELPLEKRAGADDRKLSEELDAGILAILAPRVLRKMGNRLTPGGKLEWWNQDDGARPLTLDWYNPAAAPAELLEDLRRTNPGALAWVFHFGRTPEEIRHPEQIIGEARRSMTEHGMEGRNWKYAAALPTDIAWSAFEGLGPRQAAMMTDDGMARAGTLPGREIAQHCAEAVVKNGTMGEWEPSRTREQNVRTAITLFLREARGRAGKNSLKSDRTHTT